MEKKIKLSISAINAMRRCNKQYYFVLLSNHGRKNRLRRKAFELKNMQNLNMWKGSVVDKIIEKEVIPTILSKKKIDFEALTKKASDLAIKRFRFSKDKLYMQEISKTDAGDDYCILDIHEINKKFNREMGLKALDDIKTSLMNLENIKLPSGKLLIDVLYSSGFMIPNISNWSFETEYARINPQIDLFLIDNNKPVIIDWKLSESYSSDYSRQLIICGLTVYYNRLQKSMTQNVKPYDYSDIKLYEVNLLASKIKEHEFNIDTANETINFIDVISSDVELLVNGSKVEDLEIDNFDFTDTNFNCSFCNFRILCNHLLLNNNIFDENTYNQLIQAQ